MTIYNQRIHSRILAAQDRIMGVEGNKDVICRLHQSQVASYMHSPVDGIYHKVCSDCVSTFFSDVINAVPDKSPIIVEKSTILALPAPGQMIPVCEFIGCSNPSDSLTCLGCQQRGCDYCVDHVSKMCQRCLDELDNGHE